jgi:replication factor C subunit 3/5
MSLWVDRYRPKQLSRLDYHTDQAEQLKKLVRFIFCLFIFTDLSFSQISTGDFPHLLVYGAPGAGKRTRVQCILRELYGVGVERLRIQHKQFTVPTSGKKLEIATVESNYHIEINPGFVEYHLCVEISSFNFQLFISFSDVGIYDRVVIQEVIKTMAQMRQLETGAQKEFKGCCFLFKFNSQSIFPLQLLCWWKSID